MTEPRCVTLPGRGVLRLAGADTRSFLQGLVSNDVEQLTPSRAIHAALLTPQGKYLFDFLLFARGEEILLDVERERLPALVQRLAFYRLRARVAIEDASEDLEVLAVLGPRAAAAVGLPPEAGAAREAAGGVVAVDPRLADLGVRAVVPRASAAAFREEHGLAEGGVEEWERLRLELGVPDGSRDLVPEKGLLLENGFEELNGVSFTKGCFVGQELTARTKHRALVKKRLMPVRVEGPLPEPGTPVLRGGRDAGELRSGVPGLALALLRLEQLGPGAAAGPLTAGEAVLTPVPPPWLRLPTAA